MTGIVGSGMKNGAKVSVLSLLISSIASTTRVEFHSIGEMSSVTVCSVMAAMVYELIYSAVRCMPVERNVASRLRLTALARLRSAFSAIVGALVARQCSP